MLKEPYTWIILFWSSKIFFICRTFFDRERFFRAPGLFFQPEWYVLNYTVRKLRNFTTTIFSQKEMNTPTFVNGGNEKFHLPKNLNFFKSIL